MFEFYFTKKIKNKLEKQIYIYLPIYIYISNLMLNIKLQ